MTENNSIKYNMLFLGTEVRKSTAQRGIILPATFIKSIEKELGDKLANIKDEQKRELFILHSKVYEPYLGLTSNNKENFQQYILLFTPGSLNYFLSKENLKKEDSALEFKIKAYTQPAAISVNGKFTIKKEFAKDLKLFKETGKIDTKKELAVIGLGPCLAIYPGTVEDYFDQLSTSKK